MPIDDYFGGDRLQQVSRRSEMIIASIILRIRLRAEGYMLAVRSGGPSGRRRPNFVVE